MFEFRAKMTVIEKKKQTANKRLCNNQSEPRPDLECSPILPIKRQRLESRINVMGSVFLSRPMR